MPGKDGTGPLGTGAGTGRGLGQCFDGVGLGRKQGFRHSFRNYSNSQTVTTTAKQQLLLQKSLLQSKINQIDKTLENM